MYRGKQIFTVKVKAKHESKVKGARDPSQRSRAQARTCKRGNTRMQRQRATREFSASSVSADVPKARSGFGGGAEHNFLHIG
jgi:hypothetical protein